MTVLNQRWREGRAHMRPSDPIDPSKYEVAPIGRAVAKAFVKAHHYSRSFPAARYQFGIFRGAALEGVAVFSHPANEDVLAPLPCERLAGIELGRFVLLDEVPGNGETWFLARCFEHLRQDGIEVLLSHSDPLRRVAANGNVVMPGHVGTIYQASNAVYAGRTRAHRLCLLPDATVFSERSISKIRGAERGWEREIRVLVDAGATAPCGLEPGGAKGDPRWVARRDWLWRAIGEVCRRVAHGGNHRYLWALERRLRRQVARLATGEPYPKQVD
ncbi:MAG: hypothetical protein ACTHU0_02675 [Kofleriaceae bacterium]